VTISPRHGKSEFISKWFPAWFVGMYPNKRVMLASYEADFAAGWGRKARSILEEWGHLFGVQVDPASRAANRWGVLGASGGMQTAGAGGPLTGSGADCLAEGTLVDTELGPIPIESICGYRDRIKVVSYNHRKGVNELMPVLASRRISGRDVVRIETATGKRIECTPDHRVYVCGKGYVQAAQVSPGDRVKTQGAKLPQLRRQKGEAFHQLPEMLRGIKGGRSRKPELLELRGGCYKKTPRAEKGEPKEVSGCLLLSGLLGGSSRNKEPQEVRGLWGEGGQKNKAVLRRLQAESQREGTVENKIQRTLRDLPESNKPVYQQRCCRGLLLSGLREQGTLSENVWNGESKVEEWSQPAPAAAALSESISHNATEDNRAGLRGLCCLQLKEKPSRSPYGPKHNEQRKLKPSNPLQFMPSEMALSLRQAEGDTVALVERVHEKATVYDIQVAGNQNFYANGILVHNCLIIDDPIKNAEEAYSDTIRSKLWDWWLSTAYSRIEPGGTAIVLHTRWHEDDLIGRLIQEMDNGGEPWEVINFPAIAEEHDVLGRKPGEALWPARYDEKALERIKNTIGPYWWSSLYQQRPSPLEGGMFKREWFKVIEEPGKIVKRCRYWDLAATQGGGDYTVGALIGLNDEGDYILLDVVRGQWEPHRRDAIIQATAASDGREVMVRAEQEPGASGVAQIDAMTRRLTGYRFKGEKVTGDKVVRADAASSQAGIGRIKLLKGEWNRAFLDEVTMFPNGKHDDQVDAFSGAFNALTKPVSSFCVA
jgi:predicted phage terminase large subunit-like protein